MFDRDIDAAISQLVEQWNIAERRIKKAEFTTGNQVVFSAVQELRYAAGPQPGQVGLFARPGRHTMTAQGSMTCLRQSTCR